MCGGVRGWASVHLELGGTFQQHPILVTFLWPGWLLAEDRLPLARTTFPPASCRLSMGGYFFSSWMMPNNPGASKRREAAVLNFTPLCGFALTGEGVGVPDQAFHKGGGCLQSQLRLQVTWQL